MKLPFEIKVFKTCKNETLGDFHKFSRICWVSSSRLENYEEIKLLLARVLQLQDCKAKKAFGLNLPFWNQLSVLEKCKRCDDFQENFRNLRVKCLLCTTKISKVLPALVCNLESFKESAAFGWKLQFWDNRLSDFHKIELTAISIKMFSKFFCVKCLL